MPSSRNLDLEQYLREQLKSYDPDTQKLDLSSKTQLWYTTEEQAEQWSNIAAKNFSGLESIIEVIRKKILSLTSLNIDLVDYGCGDGKKGIYVHQFLKAQGQLYQVDYSKEMLTIAAENAAKAGVEVTSMLENLASSPQFFKRREVQIPKFHLFLGQTIGNPKYPEDFIEGIVKNMQPGEYLLVEWFKTTKEHYDDPEGKNVAFVVKYLEKMGIPTHYFTKESGGLDYFVDVQDSRWFQCGVIVSKEYLHKETGRRLVPGTKIIATRSRRFKENEIIQLFEKQGLEAQFLNKQNQYDFSERFSTLNDTHQKIKSYREFHYALFKRRDEELYGVSQWITGTIIIGGLLLALWKASGIVTEKNQPISVDCPRIEETKEEISFFCPYCEKKEYLGREKDEYCTKYGSLPLRLPNKKVIKSQDNEFNYYRTSVGIFRHRK